MPAKRMKAAAAPVSLAVDAANGIAPLIALQNAFRLWWLIAGMMILGGAAGWLFHQLRPPVYEAVFGFSAGIDFVQTGNMTQFEEDVALNAIGDVLVSTPVVNQVAEQAQAEGLAVDYQSLKQMTLVERKMNAWTLRVQHVDAHLVERVAHLWSATGQAALSDAYQHAVQAERLERYIHGLESCLENAVALDPVQPVCGALHFDEIQTSLSQSGQALAAERAASRGLFAGLRLGPAEAPVVASHPVRNGLGQLVLAGGLIGLLVGIICVQTGLVARWLK